MVLRRHRQLVIICLVVLATLLCCDAWFDVTLDLRTSDFLVSLLMALCVELPLAALAVIGARRLMRLNIRMARAGDGPDGTGAAAVEDPAVRPGIPRLPYAHPGGAVPACAAGRPGQASVTSGEALSARGTPQ